MTSSLQSPSITEEESFNINDANLPFNQITPNNDIPVLEIQKPSQESGDAFNFHRITASPVISSDNEKLENKVLEHVGAGDNDTPVKSKKYPSLLKPALSVTPRPKLVKKDYASDISQKLTAGKVTFDRELSPQIFDRRDPANTPLKLGERRGSILRSSNRPKSRLKVNCIDDSPIAKIKNINCTPILKKSSSKIQINLDNISTPFSAKRSVRFNRELSPELYDKNLPTNTPIKRGERLGRRKALFSHLNQGTPKVAYRFGKTKLDKDIGFWIFLGRIFV